ncbi:hypothetical protein [Rhodococcoides corynebacterioides]|uniref:Uncharacterized protein n=1 Tax=Rhodococcoides corynebacterioides TaxID=53972 RepID=A0ABS7P448_9NOCA|nr:hypothetical protein [Rhodococcus corynebacterioides]MBY6367085.1 hypothetical protein [Rhodococcus corynebacterioides]MBY6407346.1 hypothetical protein [Rhodococcus corynebacterioides]
MSHDYSKVFTRELFDLIDAGDLRRAFAAITHAGRQDIAAVISIIDEAHELNRVGEMTLASAYAVFGIVNGEVDTEEFAEKMQEIVAIAASAEYGAPND